MSQNRILKWCEFLTALDHPIYLNCGKIELNTVAKKHKTALNLFITSINPISSVNQLTTFVSFYFCSFLSTPPTAAYLHTCLVWTGDRCWQVLYLQYALCVMHVEKYNPWVLSSLKHTAHDMSLTNREKLTDNNLKVAKGIGKIHLDRYFFSGRFT